ncbi:diguanylate cyclase response regulator [Paramagnetospirillum marisnigri]|uniref:Diguanylate cyclase response regulator n=1 Tax=Paramagnetospirillum marisnigri TaxID=1285242 RepID=A0A178MU77_9PROT|nr:GGDEF domain-containing response regulator [Paramagnetospirillum marisnigri]OAN53754.1 diguanylate cyclase response regulator [Paramagnetospirillum marisnigri]
MLIDPSDLLAFQDPEEVCSKSPFRVLVVEDDLVHFTYCEHVLRNIYGDKLILQRVTDCLGAIEALNANEYEICLLDYLVKDGSAKDVLGRVDFTQVITPVIVVSAFDDREFVLEALRHGADDYVIKGRFSEGDLHQAIQYAIYRKYKELKLRRRALYDPLTGLANRSLLYDRLDEAHRYASRHKEKFAVLVVDLDKLKLVNDSMGHEAGDRLIQISANALVSSLRASDTIARVGGDEFVAILKNVRDKQGLARLCANLLKAVETRTSAEGGFTAQISCSIGVAVYPDDTVSLAEMLRLADTAMYAVKANGGGSFKFV